MYKSGKPVTFWSAVSLGAGAMIGGGIFALLGDAGAIAHSAVYLSFIIGGIIALLSGYSLGKLGARYPAAGGIVEYLVQSFGVGIFSGAMSIMLYIAALVSLALVAKTFGSYAFTFLPSHAPRLWVDIFSVSVLLLFMLINLNGTRSVTRIENIIVLLKVGVLVVFAIVGLIFVRPELLEPATYPPFRDVLFSLAITFFAYEGFRVITNTAEDMPDPGRMLPRTMITAILMVMVLYVLVALAVFGNLSVEEAVRAKDYALAEAALPVTGQTGFVIMALAALVSTASSINANLYAVTNVTYQLAKDGELPQAFGRPIAHSREGLVISVLFMIGFVLWLDLGQIAAVGSISVLIVHAITQLGHLRRVGQTGASRLLVIAALLATVSAIGLAVYYSSRTSPFIVYAVIGFLVLSFVMEYLLRGLTGRRVRIRFSLSGMRTRA